MLKQLILAIFGYCILLGSLVAQNNDCPSAVSIELSKSNILYVGVDNPIKVSCPGLSIAEYQVKVDKGILSNTGPGLYTLKVSSLDEVELTVLIRGKQKFSQRFSAKRIPDPTPMLGLQFSKSGALSKGEFKIQTGIGLEFGNFEFDIHCSTVEYRVTRIIKGKGDTYSIKKIKNIGIKFQQEALSLINEAASGDIYIFDEIIGVCPNDGEARRKLSPLVFNIY